MTTDKSLLRANGRHAEDFDLASAKCICARASRAFLPFFMEIERIFRLKRASIEIARTAQKVNNHVQCTQFAARFGASKNKGAKSEKYSRKTCARFFSLRFHSLSIKIDVRLRSKVVQTEFRFQPTAIVRRTALSCCVARSSDTLNLSITLPHGN